MKAGRKEPLVDPDEIEQIGDRIEACQILLERWNDDEEDVTADLAPGVVEVLHREVARLRKIENSLRDRAA